MCYWKSESYLRPRKAKSIAERENCMLNEVLLETVGMRRWRLMLDRMLDLLTVPLLL